MTFCGVSLRLDLKQSENRVKNNFDIPVVEKKNYWGDNLLQETFKLHHDDERSLTD